MAELLRVKLRWQNFIGAPGYSIFHFREFEGSGDQNGFAQQAVDKVNAFATAVVGHLPYQAQLQTMGEVEVIEDSTGALVDVVGTTQPAVLTSSATADVKYAGPTGAVITWRTAGIRNGRRIKGRTFVVPIAGHHFDANGTLGGGALAMLNGAATALRDTSTSPDLGVYARPSGPGATDGTWSVVTSHSVPDMAAVLRSRRD